jgi:hypothetical protein
MILKGNKGIVLPEQMKEAINQFNPKFAVWQIGDYAPKIANDDQYRNQARIAPFAVIVDINKDGILDVILDGHDHRKALLIGVISNKGAYRVISIDEKTLVAPKTVKNSFEGKVEFGLGYYLSAGYERVVFQVINPQQSDANGELLNDGGLFKYTYKNGKFVESVQIP